MYILQFLLMYIEQRRRALWICSSSISYHDVSHSYALDRMRVMFIVVHEFYCRIFA